MSERESKHIWFPIVRRLTERLVAVRSVSPGAGEVAVARLIHDLLGEDALAAAYALCHLEPIPGDPYARVNVVAYLPGQCQDAIVLLGHIDTVGVDDFGALEPLATDPAALAAHYGDLMGATLLDHPEDWMFGRGALDMKSGVATNIAIMRHFARQMRDTGTPPPLTLVFLATPDEEYQSAGALAATGWLAEVRRREGLRYVGLINTDYVAPRFPGDAERPIYVGSVGKLLPLFYVVGKATHVGNPYAGIDANLISAELVRDLCMNPAFVDHVDGASTPPPVTLHQADLKTDYNVQTPLAAWFYLNVLTMTSTPTDLLARIKAQAQQSLAAVLATLTERYRATHDTPPPAHLLAGNVVTYAELVAEVASRHSPDEVHAALAALWQTFTPATDSRVATRQIIEMLWQRSGWQGPAVVIGIAPPYYPHVTSATGVLLDAVQAVAARHTAEQVVVRGHFPLLSDLSYMQVDPALDVGALAANMPLWQSGDEATREYGYHIPFDAIREAEIAGIVNIGPFGEDGHQRSERVYMPYSFETTPQLVLETIEAVAERLAAR